MNIIYNQKLKKNNDRLGKDSGHVVITPVSLKSISKPDYRIYLRSTNCQFDIFLNDVIVYAFRGKQTDGGAGFNGEIPIGNILLHSGEHQISAKIYPIFGTSNFNSYSFLQLKGYRTNIDNYNDDKPEIFKIEIPVQKTGYEKLPYIEAERTFEIKVPFNVVGWTRSVELDKESGSNRNLLNEIDEAYRKVYSAIQNKQFAVVKSLLQESDALRAAVFYFDDAAIKDDWNRYLDTLNDANYHLAPLPREATLHFYGYGKLAVLVDENGEGIIKLLHNTNPDDFVILDFRFHRKKKGDSLTII